MTQKEYLNQAWYIQHRIKTLQDTAEKLRSTVGVKTPNYQNDGSAFSPSPERTSETMCLIADLSIEADKLRKIFNDTVTQIMSLSDKDERFILEQRYLHRKRWGWIIEEMFYSDSTIFRIHGRALQKIIVKNF